MELVPCVFPFVLVGMFACKPPVGAQTATGSGSAQVVRLAVAMRSEANLTAEDARALVASANSCLREAFRHSRAEDLAPRLEITAIRTVSESTSRTWNLEPWDIAIDDAGREFASPSCQTDEVLLLFGAGAQARPYGAGSDHELLQEWVRVRNRIEGICPETRQPNCRPSADELPNLERRGEELGRLLARMPSAPAVWMNAPRDYGERSPIVFAHEFMHAWGGLDDRYHNPDHFDQRNLMGDTRTHLCRLDPDQIRAIRAYRERCEREDLGELRVGRGGKAIPKPSSL